MESLSSANATDDKVAPSDGTNLPNAVSPKGNNHLEFMKLITLFRVPILVLVVQLGILTGSIIFLIWSSEEHHAVPSTLANTYLERPQLATFILTSFASLLSLITTQLFSEAVRFTVNILLRSNNGMSLYTLYAANSIASKSPLPFSWRKGRKHWIILSIIYVVLFVAQTPAWTTLITPKTASVLSNDDSSPDETIIYDFNLSAPFFADMTLQPLTLPFSPFLQSSTSGMIAVQRKAEAMDPYPDFTTAISRNTSQLLPYNDFVFNGTSFGILPNISYPDGWTSIKVIQQGLTANVTCVEKPDLGQIVNTNVDRISAFGTTYDAAMFTCINGNTFSTNSSSPVVVDDNVKTYAAFSTCPSSGNTIALYMQVGGTWFTDDLGNLVVMDVMCSIAPQILNVSVTYNNTGLVTARPLFQTVTYPSINASFPVSSVIGALNYHLSATQSSDTNLVIDAMTWNFNIDLTSQDSTSTLAELMAGYIRGVIENEATNFRLALFATRNDTIHPTMTSQMHIYEQVVSWGPSTPQLKLFIMIAPLVVMISTIVLILVSFYWSRNLSLDQSNMSFNPTSMLHMVSACSVGDVGRLGSLPHYHENYDLFTKCETMQVGLFVDKERRLREGKGREGLYVTNVTEPDSEK